MCAVLSLTLAVSCFLCSLLGLVSVVSVDCAAPWWLQVNPALSWFHFLHPLTLLLLYNTVASLWRNQVTSASQSCDQSCDLAPSKRRGAPWRSGSPLMPL